AYLPFLEALESLLHGERGEAAARMMKATAPNWYAQVASLAAEDSSLARVLAESKAGAVAPVPVIMRPLTTFLSVYSPESLFRVPPSIPGTIDTPRSRPRSSGSPAGQRSTARPPLSMSSPTASAAG